MYRNLCFKQYYDNFIAFEDPEAERICLQKYDKEHDGKLSMFEVLKITQDGNTNALFYSNSKIRIFKEFAKFINITIISSDMFRNCSNLEEVWFPPNITYHWYRLFLDSPKLKKVVITGNPNWLQNTTFNKDTYWHIPPELKVYIHDQYLPKYKEDTKGWLWNDRIRPLSQYHN